MLNAPLARVASAGPLTSRMPAFLALLRGVNVGKAKRVPMAELRRVLEDLGCTNVATLLNSGNAVFVRNCLCAFACLRRAQRGDCMPEKSATND